MPAQMKWMARGSAVFSALMAGLLSLAGCSPAADEPPPPAEDAAHAETWRADRAVTGQETYELACASCHDPGQGEAPAIGDRDAWSGRSDLWVAVLSEHAKSGYLDMPGKGGQATLTDEAVAAATEYMLSKTFPELPPD